MDFLNRRVIRLAKGFIDGMNRRYISTFATNGAFYLFLSLFPLAILIGSILPYTDLDYDTVLEFFDSFVPEPMTALLEQIVGDIYGRSVAALSLSALATVWSAGKAFAAIIKGIEMVTGDLDSDFYLKRRLRASLYTLFLLGSVFVSLLLIVFGERIYELIVTALPSLEIPLHKLMEERFISTFLILTAVFLLLFHSVPRKPESWRHLLPGALFASGTWMLFSWLFSLYVSWSGSFSVYGRLATLVLAMLWMYYVVYLLLIGSWLNVYLAQIRQGAEFPAPELPQWACRLLGVKNSEEEEPTDASHLSEEQGVEAAPGEVYPEWPRPHQEKQEEDAGEVYTERPRLADGQGVEAAPGEVYPEWPRPHQEKRS